MVAGNEVNEALMVDERVRRGLAAQSCNYVVDGM